MEIAAIPFTAIVEYSRIWGIEDFDDFWFIIRTLDNAYLELNSKAQGKGNSGTNSDTPNKNHGGHQGKPGT